MGGEIIYAVVAAIIISTVVTMAFLISTPLLNGTLNGLNTTITSMGVSVDAQNEWNRIKTTYLLLFGVVGAFCVVGIGLWVYLKAQQRETVSGVTYI